MAVAATGFFDGVHSGHRAVLREIIRQAEDRGTESAVVTFWPHPRFVLHYDGDGLRLLNTIEEKQRLITGAGIDHVRVIPFTSELSRMSGEAFIREYLTGRFSVDTLVVGYDHHIGRDNLCGDELVRVAVRCGLDVCVVEEKSVGTSHVSSTVIRRCISEGDFTAASRLLGYDYSLRCAVSGAIGGRTMFRPADGYKAFPCPGSYRILLDGKECRCETDGDSITADWQDSPVGSEVQITFLEKIFLCGW